LITIPNVILPYDDFMQLYIFGIFLAIPNFTTDVKIKEYISLSDKEKPDQDYHCTVQFHNLDEYQEITRNGLLR